MACYDLKVLCADRTCTLSVTPAMSLHEILCKIRTRFQLLQNDWYVEIYDESYKDYVDFDEEYMKELPNDLPRFPKQTRVARVQLPQSHIMGGKRSYFADFLSAYDIGYGSSSSRSRIQSHGYPRGCTTF